MQHWTDRIIKWALANPIDTRYGNATMVFSRGYPVIVLKGSDAKPFTTPNRYGIQVGCQWLQANFPQSYAGFLTYLLANTSEWNAKGFLTRSMFDDEDVYRRKLFGGNRGKKRVT